MLEDVERQARRRVRQILLAIKKNQTARTDKDIGQSWVAWCIIAYGQVAVPFVTGT